MRLKILAALPVFLFCIIAANSIVSKAPALDSSNANEQHLRLYHTHTGERIDIVYRRGKEFLPEAEQQLDHFLRDHRTGEVKHYDPRVFDILSDLEIGRAHV